MRFTDLFRRAAAPPGIDPDLEMIEAQPKKPVGKPAIIAAALATVAGSIAMILDKVYEDEGGYVNHPNDPGGPTRYGITQKVARQWGYKGDMRQFPKHCDEVVKVCADVIYEKWYVDKPGLRKIIAIDPAVGDELVNSVVNFGPYRPSAWFQRSLNELGGFSLEVDGKIGAKTHEAALQYRLDNGDLGCMIMLDRLDALQTSEYKRLVRVNPKLKVFYKGWIAQRVNNVDRDDCSKGV